MAFISELIGRPVTDPEGEGVGTLQDLIARKTEYAHPVIQAIVIKRHGKNWIVPYPCVSSLLDPEIHLICTEREAPSYVLDDEDIFLARDVMNKQIIDTDGARVVTVNDVELVRVNGKVAVSNVSVGMPGFLRRIGLHWLADGLSRQLGKVVPEIQISWDDIELLRYDQAMRLKVPREKLGKLHPADVAEILADMNRAEGHRLLESMEIEQVADTLEEAEMELSTSLVEGMSDERAADVLEEMEPDDAADLLAELPPERSEELLALMDKEEAADVRMLLTYPEDTAGGLMTTEYAWVCSHMTAAEAIRYLRENCADAETLFYVYVLDENDHLEGVISLRSLLFAEPNDRIADFMVNRVVRAQLYDSQEEVAHMISKYDLLALPVVDAENRLVGIVTADDALDKIIPTAWKKRLPRFFR